MRYLPYLTYLALAFALPLRRVLYEWPAERATAYELFFFMHPWLSASLLIPVFGYELLAKTRIPGTLDRAFSIRNINVAVYASLLGFVVLEVARVPGLWWTWLTVGVHVATVGLIVNLTSGRLKPTQSLLLGLACACASAGLWEVLYQVGYYVHYDSGIAPLTHVTGQIYFVLPLVIFGLLIVCYYYRKAGRTSLLFLAAASALFAGAWAVWWSRGFWCDVVFNWSTNLWEYTEYNYLQAAVYRSSKVFLALMFTSLFAGGQHAMRGLLVVIAWLAGFSATTVFLAVTWVKARFAKPKEPYFRSRSIFYEPRKEKEVTYRLQTYTERRGR